MPTSEIFRTPLCYGEAYVLGTRDPKAGIQCIVEHRHIVTTTQSRDVGEAWIHKLLNMADETAPARSRATGVDGKPGPRFDVDRFNI